MTAVFVSLAGSLGAVSRFVLDGHIRSKHNHSFPWATLVINISGSFILGLVSGILLKHHNFKQTEAIIGVGFCGGYTTFSTASFETVRLLEKQHYKMAVANALGGLIATIIAAALGLLVGEWL